MKNSDDEEGGTVDNLTSKQLLADVVATTSIGITRHSIANDSDSSDTDDDYLSPKRLRKSVRPKAGELLAAACATASSGFTSDSCQSVQSFWI